jgi:beta-glucosidase/6-phospho-beta-glucosidase/beta-galactosidase
MVCVGHVNGNATGDVAVDQYHRYEEDIQILKDLNVDAYRFSISWPRILPVGRGHINWAGVAYYNRFINELIRQGGSSLLLIRRIFFGS